MACLNMFWALDVMQREINESVRDVNYSETSTGMWRYEDTVWRDKEVMYCSAIWDAGVSKVDHAAAERKYLSVITRIKTNNR